MNRESVNSHQLIEAAREARDRAYVPYSRFAVGAAVLTRSGRIFSGCNIENASYGLTVCAERVAALGAVVAGEREHVAVAVIADVPGGFPYPCGACRQVLAEFGPNMTVIVANIAGEQRTHSLRELLPEAFSSASLGKGEGHARE